VCGVNRSPIVPVSGRREGLLFPPFSLQNSTLAIVERKRDGTYYCTPKSDRDQRKERGKKGQS